MGNTRLSDFGAVLLFLIGGMIFIALVMLTAYLIRPHRPNEEKVSVYECGEEPSGTAWGKFNIRFYVIALIFILFDVELVFLFPWATVFAQKNLLVSTSGRWGWYTLIEMLIFIIILALGLAYAWKKGFLNWEKPGSGSPATGDHPLPEKYRKVNLKYGNFKPGEATKNQHGITG